MTTLVYYDGWYTVPEHLRAKSQLADSDLPRAPGSDDPVGEVYDRGPHGPKRRYDLFDVRASVPSQASAGQLQAARGRAESGIRRCGQCGARPDQRPSPHNDPYGDGPAMMLCHPCLHIARLRQAMTRVATDRAAACELAGTWLATDTAACVHVAPITPPPSPDGKPKRPLALRVGAVAPDGRILHRVTVWLNKSRNPIVPGDAVPAEEAFAALRAALTGRTLIKWASDSWTFLDGALTVPAEPARHSREVWQLEERVAAWRGHVDPRTYRLNLPLDPGRADLMALLIRRMAADHQA